MVAGSVAIEEAEARRGGGFGSRGARTWAAPPVTQTAPRQAQPIERSATPSPAPGATAGATAPRPGLFGSGFGGTLMRGLLIGGLIGMLFGGGLGGLAGMLGLILQLGLVALGIMLLMRFLARRREGTPATAGASPVAGGAGGRSAPPTRATTLQDGGPQVRWVAGGSRSLRASARRRPEQERLRGHRPARPRHVRADACGDPGRLFAEDTAALSRLATPEVARISPTSCATRRSRASQRRHRRAAAAGRPRRGLARGRAGLCHRGYALCEPRRHAGPQTGEVVAGDPEAPTETTEVWTFTRPTGRPLAARGDPGRLTVRRAKAVGAR